MRQRRCIPMVMHVSFCVCVCARAERDLVSPQDDRAISWRTLLQMVVCCVGSRLDSSCPCLWPDVIHLWYMWGEQLRASESAASPRLQLVLGAKKPATGRPVTPGCSYSQLWVIELDLVFRVLMTLITGSEEVLALLNLKAVLLFPQSASLRKFVYLLRL